MRLHKSRINNTAIFSFATAAIFGCAHLPSADAAPPAVKKIRKAFVFEQGIPIHGQFISAYLVTDTLGDQILLLTKLIGPSKIAPDLKRNERTDLNASYYAKADMKWIRQWQIEDFVDCPNLDHAAEFLSEDVSATDLNDNGIAEVTVPYKLFCGGGVDVRTLKIIMREGARKFAMRGTTQIQTPGNAPFGGEAVYDRSLSRAENVEFKNHMERVRRKIFIEKY